MMHSKFCLCHTTYDGPFEAAPKDPLFLFGLHCVMRRLPLVIIHGSAAITSCSGTFLRPKYLFVSEFT